MRIGYGAHDKLYTSFNIAGSILTGSSDISLRTIPNPTSLPETGLMAMVQWTGLDKFYAKWMFDQCFMPNV